jgi:hypothetical protein
MVICIVTGLSCWTDRTCMGFPLGWIKDGAGDGI